MRKRMLYLLLLFLTGCASVQTPTPMARNPFFVQMGLDEGAHNLTLEGPSRVLPGETITYTMRAANQGEQPWRDDYCLALVSRDGMLTGIAEGSLDLAPGAREDFPMRYTFPTAIAPDAYGLALIIPGKSTNVTTLHINSDAPVMPPGFESPKGCP